MTNDISLALRRTFISTLAALALAAAPQAGLAASGSDTGVWKINAGTTIHRGSNTMTMQSAGQNASPAVGPFLVVSNGKLYLAH